MKNFISKFFCTAFALFISAFAFADSEASTFVSGLSREVSGVTTNLRSVVLLVIGAISLVYAAINLVKYLRGDGQSQNALIRVVVGVAMALIVVALSGAIPGASAA